MYVLYSTYEGIPENFSDDYFVSVFFTIKTFYFSFSLFQLNIVIRQCEILDFEKNENKKL